MPDWILAQRLAVLAIVAAVVGVRAQFRAAAKMGDAVARLPRSPAAPIVVMASVGVAAAVLGSALGPRVGLTAPVLGARLEWAGWAALGRQVGSGAAGGLLAVLLIPAYYWVAPRVAPEVFRIGEAIRMGMGLPARVAMGGVLEEIITRWGVLALIAWVGARMTGDAGTIVQWVSIVGAALVFGLIHLPGLAGLSGRLVPGMVAISLALNAWLGVIAGWLVWHRGLLAAMVAHAMVHVVWFTFERVGRP